MTGFGVGHSQIGDSGLTVELRGFNHRYLDVRVRVPPELADHAFFLEQLLREQLTRGRFDAGVRLSRGGAHTVALDVERAHRIYQSLLSFRDSVDPTAEVPFSILGVIPDLFSAQAQPNFDATRSSLQDAAGQAIANLAEMQTNEGQALQDELARRLLSTRKLHERIRSGTAELTAVYRSRLKERLLRLLDDSGLSLETGRLEQEVALLADKSDITEELVRLESHFEQFEKLLSSPGSVGRRLDFLLQEIGRETNTIGAKAQQAGVSHLVVDMKSEIERLREQVQNVE